MTNTEYTAHVDSVMAKLGVQEWHPNTVAIVANLSTETLEYILDDQSHEWTKLWLSECEREYIERTLLK